MKKGILILLTMTCVILFAQGNNDKVSTALNLVVCNDDTQMVLTRQYTHDSCPKGIKPIMLIENIGTAEVGSQYVKPGHIVDYRKLESSKNYLMKKLPVKHSCSNGMTIYASKLFNFLDSQVSSQDYCKVAERLRKKQSFANLEFRSPPVVQKYDELNNISNSLSEVMNEYPGYIGIDISRYQKEINWKVVRSIHYPKPIKFVIMKATEGGTLKDKKFHENWRESHNHGLTRGAYHFYRPDADPYEQAKNFIDQVGHLDDKDIIPVIDVEKPCGTCSDLMGPHYNYMRDLKIFVQQIKNHYKTKVLFYSGNSYYYNYIKGYFPEDYFWLARYSSNYKPHDLGEQTVGWQFTNSMQIQGVSTSVDTNYFIASDFDKLKVGNGKIKEGRHSRTIKVHDEVIKINNP